MRLRGSLSLLAALALTSAAQAVEFDEKVKAPRVASAYDLKEQVESISARVSGANAVNLVRDRALAKERFDARYLLGQMVDERVPLTEFESLGLEPKGDGSYTIDGKEYPEWHTLTEKLVLLADPAVLSGLENVFGQRGFRVQDQLALRNYVQSHDLKRQRDQGQLELLLSAGKQAKKRQKLKLLDDNFMASYFYQKKWQFEEADRLWALGLLNALEPQAQRILQSYFAELNSTSVISPEDTASAWRQERELLLRPDLDELAKTAFKEGTL